MKLFRLLAFLPLLFSTTFAQQPTPAHPTGLKLPSLEVRTAKHEVDARRHAVHLAKMMMRLADPFPATYDCRNLCTPIKDQGQCGSCWDFSLCSTVESANIKTKNLDQTGLLSPQFVLDGCAFSNGGCGGDDASNGFTWLKAGGGIPLASVYGGYVAYPQGCQLSTTATGYTINDWGYCSTNPGVAATDLIKAAMLQYGPISVCIAADNAFQRYSGGVFKDTGARSIDHQIVVCGWDDTKGAWLLRNSWGTSWGEQGYMWIAYGANSVGTEAMWVTSGTPVVLQPNGPGPGPTPRPPTRRGAEVMVALVQQYQDGDDADKAQVLSLLDQGEAVAAKYKAKHALAK